jgi:hypothetical protein
LPIGRKRQQQVNATGMGHNVVNQVSIVGRLVQARWQAEDGHEQEETCLVVDDRPGEATFFPLGPEANVSAGQVQEKLPTSSASLRELARRAWAFDAAKVLFAGDLLFFAKGQEYRLLGEHCEVLLEKTRS